MQAAEARCRIGVDVVDVERLDDVDHEVGTGRPASWATPPSAPVSVAICCAVGGRTEGSRCRRGAGAGLRCWWSSPRAATATPARNFRRLTSDAGLFVPLVSPLLVTRPGGQGRVTRSEWRHPSLAVRHWEGQFPKCRRKTDNAAARISCFAGLHHPGEGHTGNAASRIDALRTVFVVHDRSCTRRFRQPAQARMRSSNSIAARPINIVVGSAVGGGYDGYAPLLARHFGKYIPGNPTVVVQNMPGAGSNKAAALRGAARRRTAPPSAPSSPARCCSR